MRLLFLALLVAVLAAARPAAALEPIGYVKTLSGGAVLIRGTVETPLTLGTPVERGDVLLTDETGSIGIAFKDNTLLAMGPSSQIVLERYEFRPADDELGFVARLVEGTLLYLSGEIAKLSPDAVWLSTPSAIIGVRGTRLLAKVE
jgi:hypothetical protein